MRWKDRLLATLTTVGLTATLTACGETGVLGGATDQVELTVVATNYGDSVRKNSEAYWTRVNSAFAADHPDISVSVKIYPADKVDAKVAGLVKAGKAPDIAQTGTYAAYADDGLLLSADEVLSIPTQSDFLPGLAEAGEVGRTQYGMPFTATTRLLYYNKKLFAAAGLKPPKSWAELAYAAETLKAQGVSYPIALPFGEQDAQREAQAWFQAGGGGYTDTSGEYGIDSAANTATLTWLRDTLVTKGLTGPVAPDRLNLDDALGAFVEGKAGIVSAPLSLMRQIADSSDPVSYGAVPLPGPEGKTSRAAGSADWLMAFKEQGGGGDTEGERTRRSALRAYLDFLYDKGNVVDQAGTYQLLPVTGSAADGMRAEERYRKLWAGIDSFSDVQLPPVGRSDWTQVSGETRRMVGEAVTRDGDPAAVLSLIQHTASN